MVVSARVILVAVVVAALGGLALAAFEPWTLWTRSTVIEAAPAATPPSPGTTAPAGPVDLAAGTFVSQEHATAGDARLIQLPDGSRVLRVEGFSTSNGPDLHVWLSEETAGGNWFKYHGARSIPLGELKGTDGDQNYDIPADADLDGIRSVVIWCDRFNVAFGSAPLDL